MKKSTVLMVLAALMGILVLGWLIGCNDNPTAKNPVESNSQSGSLLKPTKLDAPTITRVGETQHTIFLQVCAGPSGAPAGFSIQWQPLPNAVACDEFVWPTSDDPSLCKASFSGVPGCSIYNLGSNQCITVEIGNLLDAECGVGLDNCGADELECGTTYVFRAFAHNVPGPDGANRSDFADNFCCTTDPCGGCALTQGFWKNHYPEAWPSDVLTNGMTLGTMTYTADQLESILQTPAAQKGSPANALLILAHQLITAKLNLANGCSAPQCVLDAITSADTKIGGSVLPPVGTATASPPYNEPESCILDNYNNNEPDPCTDPCQ